MTDFQEKAWDCLVDQDGETVLRLLTDYHGMQLLDCGFYKYLVEEGYLEEEPEAGPEEPEDGDYIISDCGPLGSMIAVGIQNGKWTGGDQAKHFYTEEEAVKAIKADMAKQKYWPNVWRLDDHGGIELYDLESEVKYV
jgi:hypothetical protein